MRSWTLLCAAALLVVAFESAQAEPEIALDAPSEADGALAPASDMGGPAEGEVMPAPADAVPDGEEAAESAVPEPGEAILPVEDEADGAMAEGEAAPIESAEAAALKMVATEPEVEATPEAVPTWDDFDDPEFDPSIAAIAEQASVPSGVRVTARGHTVRLGPIGYDEHGRAGRLHTVVSGDTLWDVSEAYLGTPWVWPSVWHENDAIENPHVIAPADLIWITSTEMRRVTREEADSLLARTEPPADDTGAQLADESDALSEQVEPGPAAVEVTALQVPAALDQMPVSVPLRADSADAAGPRLRVPGREGMSFVTSEVLNASTSIIESPEERLWLSTHDRFYLGLGEGEVEPNQEFTIYRESDEVRDSDGHLLGYHVEVLGWAVVEQVVGESSIALVKYSVAEMVRGDRLVPREEPPFDVALRTAPAGFEGQVVFLPNERANMGMYEYLYLDRGAVHGLEVGSALEVYESGRVKRDEPRRTKVRYPDKIVGHLVVVSVKPDSAVAMVTSSRREIRVGDTVRGMEDELASAAY